MTICRGREARQERAEKGREREREEEKDYDSLGMFFYVMVNV